MEPLSFYRTRERGYERVGRSRAGQNGVAGVRVEVDCSGERGVD